MSDDAVSQLLKQFTQQVLDSVEDQGKQLAALMQCVTKISGKQERIEEKLDSGQSRFETHEQVHSDLGRRLHELETERLIQQRDQTRMGRLIKAGWTVVCGIGAGALAVGTYILDKHK